MVEKKYIGENNPFYGKSHTKETKQRIRDKLKGRIPWNKGKKYSEKTRLKISLNHANVSGSNNPMFDIHRFGKDAPNFNKKHPGLNKGNKNPSWIDGRSYFPYPPEFNEKLREKIRKRDGYICKKCSMNQKEHYDKYGRNLEIHHIDYNSQNCEEENLITLCKGCNLEVNQNRDIWEKKFNEIMKEYNKWKK